jgi:AAA domain-containing protein
VSAEPKEFDPNAVVFIDEAEVPETFNVLLYGPTGSGKSTAAATAPGPIMWVNAEGRGALAYPRKTARERGTKIYEARVERDAVIRATLRRVIEHVQKGTEPQVRTVVVDTVAKVRDALIRQLVTPGSKNSMQQFGDVAKVLEEFVRLMRDAPVNLVLLCHEDVNDAEGERIVQPLIGGVLTPKIPAEMDVVAFCGAARDDEAGSVRYLGQLVEGRGRRAKDRSGGLGQVLPLDLTVWLEQYRAALMDGVPEEDTADNEADAEGNSAADETLKDSIAAEEFSKPIEAAS